MSNLSTLWDEYLIFKDIKIYPFLMRDYDLFDDLISIFLFNKNAIGDVEIIRMSYLRFLIYVVQFMVDEKGKHICPDVTDKLQELLKYILKDQPFKFTLDEKERIVLNVLVGERVVSLSERDFDKFKNIILQQNAIPIVDSKLHPDLQKELEENMRFLAKLQGHKEGTIQEHVIAYKCKMQFESYEPIKNMTIYQFRKELARWDLITDYQIYKTAEMSGMVKFDKSIPHWRSHISDEPDYSGLLMSRNDFDNKMNQFTQENNFRR